MSLSDRELQTLDAIEAGFVRTRRIGLLRPWRGTFWLALLQLRAVAPVLTVLVGCAAVVTAAALLLPAAPAALLGAGCGAFAVHGGRRIAVRTAPARR